jgi:T3SS (YopN, CesT) and YbjN peptide-binding chaperone 1
VRRQLEDRLGSVTLDRSGDLIFEHGSARVVVSVGDAPDGEHAIVIVNSVTNWDLVPDPALFRYVATRANEIAFGALSVFERRDGKCNLSLHHALLGDTLDPDELLNAVSAIAVVADQIADEARRRFGGRRTIEPHTSRETHGALGSADHESA